MFAFVRVREGVGGVTSGGGGAYGAQLWLERASNQHTFDCSCEL